MNEKRVCSILSSNDVVKWTELGKIKFVLKHVDRSCLAVGMIEKYRAISEISRESAAASYD